MEAFLNPIDIIIIVIVGVSVIFGIIKGLIKSVFSLLAVILGMVLATLFYPTLANVISSNVSIDYISEPPAVNIISYIIIFLGVTIPIAILGRFISKIIKRADLSGYDRLAGALFGLMRGAIVAAVLVFIFTIFLPNVTGKSVLSPYIVNGINTVTDNLPPKYGRMFTDARQGLEGLSEDGPGSIDNISEPDRRTPPRRTPERYR